MTTLTPVQKAVVDRLRELGAAFMGPGVPKDTQRVDLARHSRLILRVYGKKEWRRDATLRKKFRVGSAAVHCSSVTFDRLRRLGAIEPVSEIGGVWRVAAAFA